MAVPITAGPEPEYGAKKALADSAATAASGPALQQGNLDPAAQAAKQAVSQNAPVSDAGNSAVQETPHPDRVTVSNPFMLLPTGVNYPGAEKTPIEQRYDVGRLMAVLANQPNADPEIVAMARLLQGDY